MRISDWSSDVCSSDLILLDWKPTDRLSLSANLNGFVDHGETQAAQLIGILYVTPRLADEVPLLGTYPLAPKNNRAADWDPATNYHKDNTFSQASLRGDYDLPDDITFTSVTAWSLASIHQKHELDGHAPP